MIPTLAEDSRSQNHDVLYFTVGEFKNLLKMILHHLQCVNNQPIRDLWKDDVFN